MEKIVYKIKRFDGEKHWVQEYEIPYIKGRTILWGLIYIREQIDASLNFSTACRSGICGSCGVEVNCSSVLACNTLIDDIIKSCGSSELLIGPLRNFDIIRDLVVDWEPKFERIKKVYPWLSDKEMVIHPGGNLQSQEQFEKISNATECIYCGICASECEELAINPEGFMEPFIYTKAYRYAADSRERNPQIHINPVLENGLWKCIRCMQCITKCPKGVQPVEHISWLREESMRKGNLDNKGAKHAHAFYNDIYQYGKLNEISLPVKTEGLAASIRKVPFALRLLKRGKIKASYIPRPIARIEGIRKIYRLAGEEEKR